MPWPATCEPGGIAVVDVWLPSADELARYDGRIGLEYVRDDPETGSAGDQDRGRAARAGDRARRPDLDLRGGRSRAARRRRWIREDRLRLLNADDLRAMAESAGLDVEVVAGDYDLNPIGPQDERAILVARRRGRPAPRA